MVKSAYFTINAIFFQQIHIFIRNNRYGVRPQIIGTDETAQRPKHPSRHYSLKRLRPGVHDIDNNLRIDSFREFPHFPSNVKRRRTDYYHVWRWGRVPNRAGTVPRDFTGSVPARVGSVPATLTGGYAPVPGPAPMREQTP